MSSAMRLPNLAKIAAYTLILSCAQPILFAENWSETLLPIEVEEQLEEQEELKQEKQKEFELEKESATPEEISLDGETCAIIPTRASFINPMTSGNKAKIGFKSGDLEFNFGGTVTSDAWQSKNIVFLNSNIPDEYGYIRQNIDLTGNLVWGRETFGHKAFEFFFNIRQKSLFGHGGKSTSSSPSNFKLGNTFIGAHNHISDRLLVWLRGAYIEMSINALFGQTEGPLHFLRIGHFPFTLGNGISLGGVYGAKRQFLGLYSTYLSDTQAPGILLHGDLVEDVLSYDLYYAKLQDNSTSIQDTFLNTVDAHRLGRKKNPWRGVAQDNDLIAGRLVWNAINTPKSGLLTLEPYALYNAASGQRVEMPSDSTIKLGILGLNVQYSLGNFEFGAESAFNLGNEKLYAIDRNSIQFKVDDNGYIYEQYSHIVNACTDQYGNILGPNDKSGATRTKTAATLVCQGDATHNYTNCAELGSADGTTLFNSSRRFRQEQIKDLRGWMAVVDAAYLIRPINVKLAATYGFASGDEHSNFCESDKTYTGFVGMLEGYSGSKVESLYLLGGRFTRRPLPLQPGQSEVSDESAFSDLQYVGTSASWLPFKDPKLMSLSTNILLFWKEAATRAYNADCGTFSDCCASKYLGTEWNMRLKYQTIKDLSIFADIGLFFPGGFYKDIKGMPFADDMFNKLDKSAQTLVNKNDMRIGDNMAYTLNAGFIYKF